MPSERDVEYVVDGHTMIGRLAVPDGDGQRPGVLIAHEANGLDDYQKSRARQLADLGYVGFALDYQGGGAPPERSVAGARMTELADATKLRAMGHAALEILLAEPRVDRDKIAAIGYCFGGALVLDLARSGADLKAVVGFHPGLMLKDRTDAADIRGVVEMHIGSEDPYVPLEDRNAFEAEMRAAGVDWRLHIYGRVQHTFTHPNAGQAGLPGLKY